MTIESSWANVSGMKKQEKDKQTKCQETDKADDIKDKQRDD